MRRCAHISWILKSLSNLSEGTVLTVSTLASPPGCRRMGFEDKQLTSCTALTPEFWTEATTMTHPGQHVRSRLWFCKAERP